jgi:NADH:ubiquinone oxidoreductase subunit E
MKRDATQAYQVLVKDQRVIPVEDVFILLGKVQDALGCVPRSVVCDLASRSGISVARLYGLLTAYPGFKLKED